MDGGEVVEDLIHSAVLPYYLQVTGSVSCCRYVGYLVIF